MGERMTAWPDELRAAWERIEGIGRQLADALQGDDALKARELALQRHREVVGFFEAWPADSRSAPLRLSLLHGLNAANEKLVQRGRVLLADAAGTSASTRHNQRAIHAYHAQDPGAGS